MLSGRTPPVLETFAPHNAVAATPARGTKARRVLVRPTCLALLLGAVSCTGGTFVHVPDFPNTSCFTRGVGVRSDSLGRRVEIANWRRCVGRQSR
jgi:hypothetical protein